MNMHTEEGGAAVDTDMGSLGWDEVAGWLDSLRSVLFAVVATVTGLSAAAILGWIFGDSLRRLF